MKTLIENIIKKRNANFSFHPDISLITLLSLTTNYFTSLIRGLKIIFYLKYPQWLFLGRSVKFFNTSKIFLGKYVKIGDYVYLSGLGKKGLFIGNNAGIGDYSRIIVSTSFNNPGSYIKIGNNVGMGEYAYIGGAGGCDIGNDCIIGQYFSCHPENHNYSNPEKPIRLQGVTRKGIKVGSNCWIGSKVTILDGVTIGNNCVIAAGAVVTQSMPPNSLIGGVPARVIKSINTTQFKHAA